MYLIGLLVRTLKRAVVFALGALSIWFGLDRVFPYLENKVPVAIAIILTYCVMAYFFIPLTLRIIRLFWRTNHIPLHTVTPDGFACDPVNLAISGSRRDLIRAFQSAGWYEADQKTVRSGIRMVIAFVLRLPYPTAPFSTLYLFGRGQDIGLQKPIGNSPRRRHHVRFWQVIEMPNGRFRDHVRFWLKHYGTPQPGRTLWVGAATHDTGLGVIRHNAQLTHSIHPDSNAERDYIVKDLRRTKHVAKVSKLSASKPYVIKNRVPGITVKADGQITLVELRP
jgi:hypothetical protein